MRIRHALLACVFSLAGSGAGAADWPTYRGDSRRSGISSEKLKLPLRKAWIHKAAQAPRGAWPDMPAENDFFHNLHDLSPTSTYDRAFHTAVVGESLYYGSSVDDAVYCLDVSTGRTRWSFTTEGPVRLAPAIAEGKVYVGSDDGYLYCIDAKDGRLLWKYRAGPEDRRLPGNGRMISLWPVRCGIVAEGGVVYFAAGLFPSRGVYLCAVSAEEGKEVWKRKIDVSSQGYLLASPTRLFIPTGRTSPVSFERANGAKLGGFGRVGGCFALVLDDMLVHGTSENGQIHLNDPDSRESIVSTPGLRLVAEGSMVYILGKTHLEAVDRSRYVELSRQITRLNAKKNNTNEDKKRLAELGKEQSACRRWKVPVERPCSLIKAGEALFVGGTDLVIGCGAGDGRRRWTGKVSGKAYGLAVSGGRLFVSTDRGTVHCFESGTARSRPSAVSKTPGQVRPGRSGPLVVRTTRKPDAPVAREVDVDPAWMHEADETAALVRKAVAAGGKKGRIEVAFGRSTKEARIVGATETELTVSPAPGMTMGLAWEKVEPRSLYLLGRTYLPTQDAGTHLRLARYCLAHGLFGEGRAELARALRADPGLRNDKDLLAAQALLGSTSPRAGGSRSPSVASGKARGSSYPRDALTPLYEQAAETIVKMGGISRGYCLVLGAGTGRLACEIAKRSELRVIGVEEDAGRVATARSVLGRLGLYGSRIVIHHGKLDKLPYQKFFANLIVSDEALSRGKLPPSAKEVFRVLRPSGGAVVLGGPKGKLSQSVLKKWGGASISGWKVERGEKTDWGVFHRGALPGSGEWTHAYADPGNTACSDDAIVGGPVDLQWFGSPGPRRMIDRHHRNVPPLYKAGRLFVPGDGVVFAVDAYNGTALWKAEIPSARRLGVFLDCGNMAVDDECLYWVAEDKCYGFDVSTGERRFVRRMPQLVRGEKRDWGYVALSGEMLFGSGRRKGASYTETSRAADNALWYQGMKLVASEYLFGLDRRSGRARWRYRSGLVVNTTITVGGGRVYFVETTSPKALADGLGRMPLKTLFDGGEQYLVALDAVTGRIAYKVKVEQGDFQELIYLSYARDVLVLSGGKATGEKMGYAFHAFGAPTGKILWRKSHGTDLKADGGHGEQNRHPTIVGDTVYAWPHAYDLKTGEQVGGWKMNRRGHGCGGVSASEHALFWRGGNPWMHDLRPGGGPTRLTRVTRPGCWINIIPAGGLVLIPEASSGCTCPFSMQTSMALAPRNTSP